MKIKIKAKNKPKDRIIDDAPLYRYRIDGGDWVVSSAKRYLVQFKDGRKVWYHETHPVVRFLNAQRAKG